MGRLIIEEVMSQLRSHIFNKIEQTRDKLMIHWSVVRLTIKYGSESWLYWNNLLDEVEVVAMKVPRMIMGASRIDKYK